MNDIVMPSEFTGYHGTNSAIVPLIQKGSFNHSQNDDDWLGQGVYFFIDGISVPLDSASEWAKNQAYCKESKNLKYKSFSVLECKVVSDSVLNTTQNEGLKAFDSLRNVILQKHRRDFGRDSRFQEHDRIMWDLVAKYMKVEVVIHNLYIKNCVQRKMRVSSNVPNVTVMCVKDSVAIDKNSIKVVSNGEVKL